MFRIATESAWQRRRRLAGTALAIVLGVAFLVGTLVLGDTFAANFDRLFTETAAGTDVVIRNATSVSDEPSAQRGFIDAGVVDTVGRVDGVATALAEITGYGQLLSASGDPIGGNGPPRIAGTWIDDPTLNPYRLVEGRAPRSDQEVVINRGTAKRGDLHVGDTTVVQTPRPVSVTIVGIATFGDEDGFGGTTFTAFTLAGAERFIAGQPGLISDVLVAGDGTVSDAELRDRIARALPPGTEAITGSDLVDERIERLGFLTIVRVVLVGFAAVALLVATVSISNTFTITVAQRTRELALLRAVGASGRQIKRLVRYEALTVGTVAAVAGCAVGLGLAVVLKGVFAAFGSGLPDGGLTVNATALLAGVAVGIAVTVLSARAPARRAAALAPVAALRDTHVDAPIGKSRAIAGCAVLLAGMAAALAGTSVLGTVVAVLAFVVGTLLIAPALLRVASAPLRSLTARSRGTAAALAAEHVARQPRRSAGAATALLIGVSIVALFTVFAASASTAIDEQVDRGFGAADLAVATPAFGGGVLGLGIVDELEALDEVDAAAGTAEAPVRLDGRQTVVTATDPAALEPLFAARVVAGHLPDGPSDAGLVVERDAAGDHGWTAGSTVAVGFVDGTTIDVPVVAVIDAQPLLDDVIIPTELWIAHQPQPGFNTVLVTLAAGADPDAARAALDPIAHRYSGTVEDRAEYGDSRGRGLDLLLGVVYVMLALAILIALLGIANTLSLSIHERRREIGLLRAVGQTRRQTRRSLRVEAIMLSTFGTVLGCVVGTVGGMMLYRAAFDDGSVSIPVTRLAIIVGLGVVAGTVASWHPGRRAARLAVLDAIGRPA
jgi:putative ABC transport system permease protein